MKTIINIFTILFLLSCGHGGENKNNTEVEFDKIGSVDLINHDTILSLEEIENDVDDFILFTSNLIISNIANGKWEVNELSDPLKLNQEYSNVMEVMSRENTENYDQSLVDSLLIWNNYDSLVNNDIYNRLSPRTKIVKLKISILRKMIIEIVSLK
jgi:hypothetical protein